MNGDITYSPDSMSPFDYGTTATHSCNEGFFVNGNQVRICSGDGLSTFGSWDASAPLCSGIIM